MTEQQDAGAAAEEAVDEKVRFITRYTGINGWLYDLEELIARRTAARIRALPGAETMTAVQAADAIDPELRHRARQEPCTVVACPIPDLRVLVEWNGNSLGIDVPRLDYDRVDTLLLTTDDKLTLRYGRPAQPGQDPVAPPVPGRARLLAHIRVPARAVAIHPEQITTYPWET